MLLDSSNSTSMFPTNSNKPIVSERGNVDRRDIAQKICEFPYVVRCNVVAGDWDLLIEVVSPSMDSLGDAILDGLSKVGGIASTQTMVSFYDYSGPASSLR